MGLIYIFVKDERNGECVRGREVMEERLEIYGRLKRIVE